MAHAPSPITPRKTPRQARAVATRAALLEAAARILEAEGAKLLTTNRIAERAGVSIGTLYQYFPGKQAILAALIRQMRRELEADLATATAAAGARDLAAAVAALCRAVVQHHIRRPGLAEALEALEPTLPPDPEALAIKTRIRDGIAGLLKRHAIAEPERAAFDLSAMGRGLVGASAAAGRRDFEALAARFSQAALGYLRGPRDA